MTPPLPSQALQPLLAPIPAPVDVVLFGVERLVPRGVEDELAEAWLQAPIGGVPLYRRLFEPLVGLNLDEVKLVGGRIAEMLIDLLRRKPIFGLRAKRVSLPPFKGVRGATTLMLPGSGLLDLDVRILVGRLAQGSTPNEAQTFSLGDDVHGHVIPSLGPRSTSLPASEFSPPHGRLLRVDTPEHLIATARAALHRTAAPWHAHGDWQSDVLYGGCSTISPTADLGFSACAGCESAVGSLTMVEGCVRLGPGAVIGRKSYVCEGASIVNSVVLDGTFVSPWTSLRNAVLWRNRELS